MPGEQQTFRPRPIPTFAIFKLEKVTSLKLHFERLKEFKFAMLAVK